MTSPATHIIQNEFEQLYIRLREKEGRLYTDEEVINLPEINETHPYYKEWHVRRESMEKLIHYLKKRNSSRDLLEIGCGNGWLARQLATLPGSKVIGTDINFTELGQAARVFKDVPGLHFIYGDVEAGLFEKRQFDIIVFGASIQYFSSITGILHYALRLLRPTGEIHILDSPFYKPGEVVAAKHRTRSYYEGIGFPEMVSRYFHHELKDLEVFNYEIMYRPLPFSRYLKKYINPFPWITIKK